MNKNTRRLIASGNIRATHSTPVQSRSESNIAINPRNPLNIIGVSKKFTDPHAYLFKIGAVYTFDGGRTWAESELPVEPGWDCLTDPWIAFDTFGNAFLIAEPDRFHPARQGTTVSLDAVGMYAYRTRDGGRTWDQPQQLDADSTDDKQCVVCDNHPRSPHFGNVYVVWGDGAPLMFARSINHGNSWEGQGGGPVGEIGHVDPTYGPELSVSSDGTLHILWHVPASAEIFYVRSTDGGNSFEHPVRVVDGMRSLNGHLPNAGGFPHFPGAKFRVTTMVSDCTAGDNLLVVVWADMREKHSRIYFRRSLDNGKTWEGPESGQALLPDGAFGEAHCCLPQVAATKSGAIGCTFYTYGLENGWQLIKVQLAVSFDNAATFSELITVSDRSWDPLVNAPHSYGMPHVHFIGDYFGIDAGQSDFVVLWTDTRTGVQELFFDRIRIEDA
jgi:hypothetical protein